MYISKYNDYKMTTDSTWSTGGNSTVDKNKNFMYLNLQDKWYRITISNFYINRSAHWLIWEFLGNQNVADSMSWNLLTSISSNASLFSILIPAVDSAGFSVLGIFFGGGRGIEFVNGCISLCLHRCIGCVRNLHVYVDV